MAEFDEIIQDIESLLDLSERKIAAVSARRAPTLMTLLQAELDPLDRINHQLLAIGLMTAEQKSQIGHLTQRWADRERYLAELIETRLGYIDFVHSLFGMETPHTVDLGL